MRVAVHHGISFLIFASLLAEDEGEKPTGKQKPAKKGKSAAGLRWAACSVAAARRRGLTCPSSEQSSARALSLRRISMRHKESQFATSCLLPPCPPPPSPLCRLPKSVKALQDRCQSVLGLLAELLGVVPLHTGTLAPLVRVAMQALTVEGIPLLQAKATGVLGPAWHALLMCLGDKCGLARRSARGGRCSTTWCKTRRRRQIHFLGLLKCILPA